MNVIERIQQHLAAHPQYTLSVCQGSFRLAKQTLPKYSFSAADVEELFGGVPQLIKSLPERGFTSGTRVELKRLRGSGAEQRTDKMDTLILNFKEQNVSEPMPQEPNTAPIPAPVPAPSSAGNGAPILPMSSITQAPMPPMGLGASPMGLGYTPVATTEWISSKVTEERYRDLLRDNENLREDNKDLRSQVRTLNEEKASLRLQLDTADKKHELHLKEELLNKKGFWESPAFERVTETLGGIVPMVMEKMMTPAAAAPALAQPDSSAAAPTPPLSVVKREFIRIISAPNITDEQVGELYDLLMSKNNENE